MKAKKERRPGAVGEVEVTVFFDRGSRRTVRRIVEEDAAFEVTVKTGTEDTALGQRILEAVIEALEAQEASDERNA